MQIFRGVLSISDSWQYDASVFTSVSAWRSIISFQNYYTNCCIINRSVSELNCLQLKLTNDHLFAMVLFFCPGGQFLFSSKGARNLIHTLPGLYLCFCLVSVPVFVLKYILIVLRVYMTQKWDVSRFKIEQCCTPEKIGVIFHQPPHHRFYFTMTTFPCSQGGRCGEVGYLANILLFNAVYTAYENISQK